MIYFSHLNLERGFLPAQDPLIALPDTSTFHTQLNELAQHLPELLSTQILGLELDKLNHQYTDTFLNHLTQPAQQNIATLILLILAQAYIWEKNDAPKQIIPAVLARNIYQLCKKQQRFPTLTYADYALHNWQRMDKAIEINLENIKPILSFTNSTSEAWFIKIHVVIEYACRQALEAAYQIYLAAQQTSPSIKQIHASLNQLTASLQEAISILKKMLDGCEPRFYWLHLRPYLNGWEKVHSQTNNKGIQFENHVIHGKTPTYSYKGASGAQSSIIPALDAILDIPHEMDELYQTLLSFQQYMPKNHVLFIQALSQVHLQDIIAATHSQELTQAWEQAVEKLALFRFTHLELIQHYIYYPAKAQGLDPQKIAGTGGTSISDYLGDRYIATRESKL
jgi:indoleamine 2,3-dioxygenase